MRSRHSDPLGFELYDRVTGNALGYWADLDDALDGVADYLTADALADLTLFRVGTDGGRALWAFGEVLASLAAASTGSPATSARVTSRVQLVEDLLQEFVVVASTGGSVVRTQRGA